MKYWPFVLVDYKIIITAEKNRFLNFNLPLKKTLVVINNNQKFDLKNIHKSIKMLHLCDKNYMID